MGLSLSVNLRHELARHDPEGQAPVRRRFTGLSRALAAEGLDWQEPTTEHTFSGGFPYGYLHQLRRLLVRTDLGLPLTPAADVSSAELARDEELVRDETAMLSSHLLCHSDGEGYYVPVDFPDPLFLPESSGVAGGGMVGSTQRLLAELDRITRPGEAFESERHAWDVLRRACLTSLASGHAIVFL